MNSPTITSPAMMTGVGIILGTAAYMSPEQAKGRTVDRRSDVWAFGAVLYEMLTARRAFEGDDVSDTLARILMKEPDWTALPATVPAAVVTVIRRCLQKDRKQRVRDIGDVSLALEGAFETVAPQATATASTHGRHAWMAAFAVAVVGMIALGVPALRHVREAPPSATRLVRFSMDLAPADRLGRTTSYGRPSRTAFAIAPDGATIVFVGEVQLPSPSTMLYRRPLAEAHAVAIPGTEGAEYPFFSPDGQSVGFGAGNKLKKVALSGGPPIDICDFPVAGRLVGASWGSAGVIAFVSWSGGPTRGLWTVSDSGGKPDALFESNPDVNAVSSPAMLPDGQTVLFTVVPGNFKWEDAHVDAINVMTKQRKRLLTNAADARYSPTGHLVFVRNAALLAVPFDATRVDVTGAPVPLLAGIMQSTNAPVGGDETGMGQFALSASGTLLYASGDRYPTETTFLMRVDRKGAETKLAEIPGSLFYARLDSAGARVAAVRTADGSGGRDIWLHDLPSGTARRLTSTGDATRPLFSLDGKSITFVRLGSDPGIYALPLNGSAAPQRLIEGAPGSLAAASWSSDGKWLAYLQDVGGVMQIFVRPAREDKPEAGEPRPFSPSTFAQRDAEFSPDSRWIAYSSNESGAQEVYVQAFPGPGQTHRISRTGGSNPAWSRDGRELFYFRDGGGPRPLRRQMFAADVSTTGDFKYSVPRQLFEGPYLSTAPLRSYDVTADGQFIMVRQQPPPTSPSPRSTSCSAGPRS